MNTKAKIGKFLHPQT